MHSSPRMDIINHSHASFPGQKANTFELGLGTSPRDPGCSLGREGEHQAHASLVKNQIPEIWKPQRQTLVNFKGFW